MSMSRKTKNKEKNAKGTKRKNPSTDISSQESAPKHVKEADDSRIDFIADKDKYLPPEVIVNFISPHMNAESLCLASMASKSWCHFFSEAVIWQNRFAIDYSISHEMLATALGTDSPTGPMLRDLYKKFYVLVNSYQDHMPVYVREMLRDPDNAQLLLICATDHAKRFHQNCPPEEYGQWFTLTAHMGCVNIPLNLYKNRLDQEAVITYLFEALSTGNKPLADALYALENKTQPNVQTLIGGFSPNKNPKTYKELCAPQYTAKVMWLVKNKTLANCQQLFNGALEAGNFQLVSNLIHTGYHYTIDEDSIERAAMSGNAKLLNFMLRYCGNRGVQVGQMALHEAASSGNIACVEMLLNKHELAIDIQTINFAMHSGHIPMVRFLLKSAPQLANCINDTMVSLSAALSKNNSLSQCYLPCYSHLLEVVAELRKQDPNYDNANALLKGAYVIAPKFFTEIIQTILEKPTAYGLSVAATQKLTAHNIVSAVLGNNKQERFNPSTTIK